jgi:uncharacterized protein with NRDE domain
MCLLALAIDQSRRFPLVVAANRDEFFKRETARLGWWSAQPGEPPILGGRDLDSGGTWMGLTAQGRLALLTNVRGPRAAEYGAPSRGRVVTDWLAGGEDTGDFWMRTALSGYNGFNLIAADFLRGECFWGSNTGAHPRRLDRGIYGLSNGGLDAPWPKVTALKAQMQASMSASMTADELAARLFESLADRTIAADDALPQTGVPLELERQLSPAFIRTADNAYGTRSSTLIITEKIGRAPVTHVYERSFAPSGEAELMRRAVLKNWPPRYLADDVNAPVEPGLVSEHGGHEVEDGDARLPRTRVRSLLKPPPDRRRRRSAVVIA